MTRLCLTATRDANNKEGQAHSGHAGDARRTRIDVFLAIEALEGARERRGVGEVGRHRLQGVESERVRGWGMRERAPLRVPFSTHYHSSQAEAGRGAP